MEQQNSSMMDYQNWMQQKSYSQHIGNLIRIRGGKSLKHSQATLSPKYQQLDCSVKTLKRCKTASQLSEPTLMNKRQLTSNKSSNIITPSKRIKCSWESVKHHSRSSSQKQNILQRKNLQMCVRIQQAKPVISVKKQEQEYQEYKELLKRRIKPVCADKFQNQNLKKFLNFEREVTGRGRFSNVLDIQVDNLKKVLPKETQLWIEVTIHQKVYRSNFMKFDKLAEQVFRVFMDAEMSPLASISLYAAKGISSLELCQLKTIIPAKGRVVSIAAICKSRQPCQCLMSLQYAAIPQNPQEIPSLPGDQSAGRKFTVIALE